MQTAEPKFRCPECGRGFDAPSWCGDCDKGPNPVELTLRTPPPWSLKEEMGFAQGQFRYTVFTVLSHFDTTKKMPAPVFQAEVEHRMESELRADLTHAVTCVNALHGIDDPKDFMDAVSDEVSNHCEPDGSPCHCHLCQLMGRRRRLLTARKS